jgi:hypothetical protein
MKFKPIVILCLVLSAICLLAACNVAEENVGGDQKSKDRVTLGTGPWKPEDITENPALDGEMDAGMVSEGRLYFHFSESKTEALLVDSNGSLTWLYSKNDKSIFEAFDTGDYVRVGHGMIMESYPGQTYISQIALIEEGDVYSFTDEEWERLSGVFVGGLER